MLEISHKLVFGVILFIIIAVIFMRLYTSPECNAYANQTVMDLQKAINEVSTDDVKEWYGNGPPPNDKQEYYRPVLVRLCENSGKQFIENFFVKLPTYQISWGEFPTAPLWATWDESYPFSGGAGNALLMFGGLKGGKYAGKAAIKAGKIVYRVGKITLRIGIKNAIKSSRLVKWIRKYSELRFRALIKSVAQETEEGVLERFVKNEIPENYRALVRGDTLTAKRFARITKMSIDELAEAGVIKRVTEQMPADLQKAAKGRFIVNDMYIPLFHALRDAADDNMRRYFDDVFYIPSRFNFLERTRFRWIAFKEAADLMWKNSKLYRNVVDPINKGLRETKKKFFKVMGSEISDAKIAATARKFRKMCLRNPKECRTMFEEAWNLRIESAMSNMVGRKVTKETFSDADMFRFMAEYEKWVIFEERSQIVGYSTQMSDNLRTGITSYLKEISSKEPTEIREILKSRTAFRDGVEKHLPKEMVDKLNKKDLEKMIEKARQQVELKINKNIVTRGLSIKKFNQQYSAAFKRAMIEDPNMEDIIKIVKETDKDEAKAFIPYIAYNVVDPAEFLKSKIKREAKGLWYIKLGRYYPTYALANPIQARANPLVIPGGGYASKIMEQQLTEGCVEGALCYTHSGYVDSYLLNESAQRYAVRLWRPKPNLAERTTIFISTGIFYPAIEEHPKFYVVSPCFSMMKVWKSGGTVFISPDVDMTTGDIVRCSVQDKEGYTKKVANYCFATFNDVWGANMYGLENTASAAEAYIPDGAVYGWMAGILGGCTAATIGYKACVDAASFASQAIITADAALAAGTGSKNWGYWTYNKAADVSDLLSMISGRGVATSLARKAASAIAPDFSTAILVMGDLAMEWPARGIYEKDKGLSAEDIYLNTGRCAWTGG